MQIRRYQGADEAALLRRIREDLGPDAVVLHTAFVKDGGVFGFFARRRVEIVAGAGFRVVREGEGRPVMVRLQMRARPARSRRDHPRGGRRLRVWARDLGFYSHSSAPFFHS